jgi:tetratricopeptide (TPR) repeat protein/O-antigen ligase
MLFVYLVIVSLWLLTLRRKKRPFPSSVIDIPLALLAGLALLATVFSIEPWLSLQDLPLYFVYAMVYYLVIDRLRAGWKASTILNSLVMAARIVCVVAILEYLSWYFGLPLFDDFQQGWWSVGGWRNPLPPDLYRLTHTLYNPNRLASFLSSTLPVSLALAMQARSRTVRILNVMWMVLMVGVLLLTFSRGGLLGAAGGILTFVLITKPGRGTAVVEKSKPVRLDRWLLLSLVVAAAVMVIAVLAIAPNLLRPAGIQFRVSVWQATLQMIRDQPLTGIGPRAFGINILHYWNPQNYPVPKTAMAAHNILLHTAAEIGVPGALVLAGAFLLVLRAGHRQIQGLSRQRALLVSASMAGLVAFAIHGMVDHLLPVPAAVVPVLALAAICSAEPIRERRRVHRLLTPGRALLLVLAVAGWMIWYLFGMSRFGVVFADALAQEWPSAAERLESLPKGVLPDSFREFQRGVIYGNLALRNPDNPSLDMAIKAYEQGLSIVPEYLPAHANLIALYGRQGDVGAEQRAFENAYSISGTPATQTLYLVNRGLLYEEEGKETEATAAYADALALSPPAAGSVFWSETEWRRQHWMEILEQARAYIQGAPDADRAAFRTALLEYYAGDTDSAARALAGDEPSTLLAQVRIEEGKLEEAIQILDQVTSQSAGRPSPLLYLLRGQAKLLLGEEERAEQDLKTAAFLGNRRAYYYLGRLALSKGDAAAAIALYRHSLTVPHNLLEVNSRYSSIAFRQGGIANSNLLPRAALPPSLEMANVYLELAELYLSQGEDGAAVEIVRQLLSLSPGFQPALDRLNELGQSRGYLEADTAAIEEKSKP